MNKSVVDERAKTAYDFVKKVYSRENSKKKEFRSYVNKMPAMILRNGLGNAVAFACEKGWTDLLRAIQKWLTNENCPLFDEKFPKNAIENCTLENNALVQRVFNSNAEEYRALTDEILSYLNWLRRFAVALLKDEEEQEK